MADSPTIPPLCRQRHKHRADRAFVVIDGKRVYLGRWDDPDTQLEYKRLIAEWLTHGQSAPSLNKSDDLRIVELCNAFWQHINKPNTYREPQNYTPALKTLRQLYGHTRVHDFDLLAFETVQQAMVDHVGKNTKRPWSRKYVNQNITRLTQMFRWGKKRKLVPPAVLADIEDVDKLQRGRTAAPETKPVTPVPLAHVFDIRHHVSRQVWAMIMVQFRTGARPGEVTAIRPMDINRSSDVWIYTPADHKNAHREKTCQIYLGRKAQAILHPFLKDKAPDEFVFSPKDAEQERSEAKRQARKSKVQPSQIDRSKPNPKRKAGSRYTTTSYGRAITRAVQQAVPHPTLSKKKRKELTAEEKKQLERWRPSQHWHPNQLRHNYATAIRREYGLELAATMLGHSKIETTQIYAEVNVTMRSPRV